MIGTTDERMFIDRVGPGSQGLIGYRPAELLGKSILTIVHETTIPDLLEVFEEASSSREHGAVRAVALRAKRGDVVPCNAVVIALVPASSSAFAFIPEGAQLLPTTATARQRFVQQLGGVLWQPGDAQVGADLGIDQLTTRELDIVTLLVSGDRVRSIAQRLFLSQSTVRSHLSVIFSKFGVRSQSELLDLLRARYRESPDRDLG
jgi:PAS domain S-box-containing protein